MKVKIIAEIGINANGDINIAKKLIDLACVADCDYVKFQKRTPSICVPEHQKNKPKSTPFGEMTYLEYKEKIEFGEKEYKEIDKYCEAKNIKWFASVWDILSAKFMKNMKVNIVKIPSAMLGNDELLEYCCNNFREKHLSTGMSIELEIQKAIEILKPTVIYHTNSSYPCKPEDLNLGYLSWLKHSSSNNIKIGYSGHEFGLVTTFGAVAMGAEYIERHITLDHDMWGSDQSSSVDPVGLIKLTRGIRDLEKAIFEGNKPRVIYEKEKAKINSLKFVKK